MKKVFNSKNFITFTVLILLFFAFIFVNICSYTYAVSSSISNNIFRLHVIANSNSEEDQSLKYIVRDSILNYINNCNKNISCKEDLINSLDLDTIKNIAQDTIYSLGFNYPVNVEIGNFEFPTKNYGDISFPKGFYDALRVKIGNASRKKLVVCNVSSFMFY